MNLNVDVDLESLSSFYVNLFLGSLLCRSPFVLQSL